MQVNNIRSNSPSFGAKLVIDDYQGVLKGAKRVSEHSLNKVRAFSALELKQIEKNFEQQTKDLTGKMVLKTGYSPYSIHPARGPFSLEFSTLYYYSEENTPDTERLLEVASITLLDNFPKTANEFVNRLVGAFTVLENKHAQTMQIRSLEDKLKTLITKRDNDSLSEVGKHFEIKKLF